MEDGTPSGAGREPINQSINRRASAPQSSSADRMIAPPWHLHAWSPSPGAAPCAPSARASGIPASPGRCAAVGGGVHPVDGASAQARSRGRTDHRAWKSGSLQRHRTCVDSGPLPRRGLGAVGVRPAGARSIVLPSRVVPYALVGLCFIFSLLVSHELTQGALRLLFGTLLRHLPPPPVARVPLAFTRPVSRAVRERPPPDLCGFWKNMNIVNFFMYLLNIKFSILQQFFHEWSQNQK